MLTLPDYKVLNCLYIGTISTLYRALRLANGLPVIIKVSTQKALTEKKAQCFQREFDIGQQIHSPQVVYYLESRQDPTYGIALIMEDDESIELTSLIPEQGFSKEAFLKIAIQIVQGLQVIHVANIIHKDLKLSNIVIQPSTQYIKIIDFNRASSLRQEIQAAISTQLEVGILAYISPEQTGRINRNINYRTDFYSPGATFFQLLCGQLPFVATGTLGLVHQHLAKQPAPTKLTESMELARTWMPEARRNSLYPILDNLSDALTSLTVSIIKPEAKYQVKISNTSWQLFCLKGPEECLVALNIKQETQVDHLLEIIQRTDTPLQAKKMLSGAAHSLAISFNNDNVLIASINALIFNIQAQRILQPISH